MTISLSLPAPVKSTSTVTPPSRYLTAKRELYCQFQNPPQAQITLFYNIMNFWRLRKHSQENLLKTRSCRIFDGTLVSPTSLFTVVLVFVASIGGWVICLLPCGFDAFSRGPLGILWAQWDCLMVVSGGTELICTFLNCYVIMVGIYNLI